MTGPGTTHMRAGLREWLALGLLALPVVLLALDLTVLHLALPQVTADLRPSALQQLWILDIYGFLVAGFLVTMGNLADRIGRRRLLFIGAAAFGAASVLAAFAPSAEVLLVARALLGVAGATFTPSTLSLLRNIFHDPKQRAFAIAVWMACFAGGGAIGPVVGGILLEWFWWGSVFLLGLPVMVLLLAAGPFLLPEYRAQAPGRLDLTSVVLSLAAILPVVYAIKEVAKDGWSLPAGAVLLAGLAFGWVFARRQTRVDSPLLDLRLFRVRAFSVGLSTLLLAGVSAGALTMLLAQYLQLVAGLPPAQAGLWMAPLAVASIAASLVAPALARLIGAGRTVAVGMFAIAAGMLMIAQVATTGFATAITASIVLAIGMGINGAVVIDLIVNSAPADKVGSASSISETVGELGQALGIATLGAVATAVYRLNVAGALPGGLPDEAAQAAGDSLPGAVAAADGLPAADAEAVIGLAQAAFGDGLTAVGYVGAALTLVAGVLALLRLPNAGSAAEPGESAADPADTDEGRDGGGGAVERLPGTEPRA